MTASEEVETERPMTASGRSDPLAEADAGRRSGLSRSRPGAVHRLSRKQPLKL